MLEALSVVYTYKDRWDKTDWVGMGWDLMGWDGVVWEGGREWNEMG